MGESGRSIIQSTVEKVGIENIEGFDNYQNYLIEFAIAIARQLIAVILDGQTGK